MADMAELKNLVRKGIVHNVDVDRLKARVKFGDKGGIISAEMHILANFGTVVPSAKEKTGDRVGETQGHEHEAYLAPWVPQQGELVLCLMVPDGDGEGYILGGIR